MSTRASRFDRWLLQALRKMLGPVPLDLVLDTGGESRSPVRHRVATIRFADRETLSGSSPARRWVLVTGTATARSR